MSDRYERMFARLKAARAGAFVPFTVLGDPDPETSAGVVRALLKGGADALELGIPFSDPIADGPVIQAADVRALAAGMRPSAVWSLIRALRDGASDIPIGLLVYANLVEGVGRGEFYAQAAAAGVDSVLVADVPALEAAPFVDAARAAGVQPVLIAAPTSPLDTLRQIARLTAGFTYVVTRAGVTGADHVAMGDRRDLLKTLAELGAPPALLGFGISEPAHVGQAIAAGAAGAISGSAVVEKIAAHRDDRAAMLAALETFVRHMKAATLA